MKALLTAFAVLSFVAASTLPMAASAADAQADHTMTKTDTHMSPDKSVKANTAKHTTKTHKRTTHKAVKHHRHTAAKHKTHKTPDKVAPKAG